jgi:hypothetical protein
MVRFLSVLILPIIVFAVSLNINNVSSSGSGGSGEKSIRLNCPDFLSSGKIQHVNWKQEGETDAIDQAWYGDVLRKIRNDEYNITYDEETGSYQSPNRMNNLRFIYHNDGFTATTRTNRIPKFDVSDNTLKEEGNEYETVDEWSVKLKVESACPPQRGKWTPGLIVPACFQRGSTVPRCRQQGLD